MHSPSENVLIEDPRECPGLLLNPSKNRQTESLESIPTNLKDDDGQSTQNPCKELVFYEPDTDNASDTKIECPYLFNSSSNPPRTPQSIGAFTVQCSECFKWRIIPTKDKYEEIRENIVDNTFVCERAEEWGRKVSCFDPSDFNQDSSRLWAIDKPSISRPPSGWERLLKIRGQGCTRFADVYYRAPCGKKLRSMVQVQKYLYEHPSYTDGVRLSQFSFICPKPLQENYVRKRPARLPFKSDEGNPLSVEVPIASTEGKVERPGSSASSPGQQSPVKNKSPQFSFLCPKPLQENYVKKRPACLPFKSDEGNPLSVEGLIASTEVKVERPGLSSSPPGQRSPVKNKSLKFQVENSSHSRHGSPSEP